MSTADHKDSEKFNLTDMYNLPVRIKSAFLDPSAADSDSKWSLLKDYQSKYLELENFNVILFSSYHAIASTLIDVLKPTLFTHKHQENVFDEIFLKGVPHEAFLILTRKLEKSCESYMQSKILDLLEKFIRGKSLECLILHQCLSTGSDDPQYIAMSEAWNEILTFMVSLPERIANKTKGQMHKLFHTEYYMPHLVSTVMKVLSLLHVKIKECHNCTLEFIGKVIGKLCILGHGETVSHRLGLQLTRLCETDLVWRKMCHSLITKMPSSSLESFVTFLLLNVPWYGYVEWILGEEGTKNKRLNYILTTKLLLVRHFRKEIIIQNIIGYFASIDSRRTYFWDILRSLLRTWTDSSVLKHHSFEQQLHLASALIVCAGWVRELNDRDRAQEFEGMALQGTSIRVGNSEAKVRNLGMIVAELLLGCINPEGPEFKCEEIVDKEMLTHFRTLLVIPSNPGKDLLYTEDVNLFEETDSARIFRKNGKENTEESSSCHKVGSDEEDLEPFDMSNDVSQLQQKRPFYLKDCIKGLVEQDNEDWFEACLKHAVALVEANANVVHEVAVEMAKILLHLDNKYPFAEFETLRHNVLVTLTVHSPILVAGYLTSQFYERDYNIQHRLFILEVLADASRELSKPKETTLTPPQPNKELVVSSDKTWQSIVDERVAAKTRYITKTPRNVLPEMLENRFSPVAGYFFYPLLEKYDQFTDMLQLFGQDSYVLGRLIFTLAVIMRSASNIPSSGTMGEALLQFLCSVRNHTDVVVRQASIFALASVYSSVPPYLLFSDDLSEQVYESQHWLQSVIEQDPDTNCQVRATNVLGFCLGLMKNEVPFVTELMNSEI